jgi:hypothetical protein
MNRTLSVSLSLTSYSSNEVLSSLVQKLFLKKIFLVVLPLYVCLLFESSSSFILSFLWGHLLVKQSMSSQLKQISGSLPVYLLVPFFSLLTNLATSSSSSKMSLLLPSDFAFCLPFFFDLLML